MGPVQRGVNLSCSTRPLPFLFYPSIGTEHLDFRNQLKVVLHYFFDEERVRVQIDQRRFLGKTALQFQTRQFPEILTIKEKALVLSYRVGFHLWPSRYMRCHVYKCMHLAEDGKFRREK